MNMQSYVFLSPDQKSHIDTIQSLTDISLHEIKIVTVFLTSRTEKLLGTNLIELFSGKLSKSAIYNILNRLIDLAILGKQIIGKQTYYFLQHPREIQEKFYRKRQEEDQKIDNLMGIHDVYFPNDASYTDGIYSMEDVIALHEEINKEESGTVIYTSGQGSLCMGEDKAIEWYDRFKKKGLINHIMYGKHGYHFWSDTFHMDIHKHAGISHTDLRSVQLDPQELYCIVDDKIKDIAIDGYYYCVTPSFVARFIPNTKEWCFQGSIVRDPNIVHRTYISHQALWKDRCPEKEDIFYYDLDRVNKTRECQGYKYKKEPQAETLCSE